MPPPPAQPPPAQPPPPATPNICASDGAPLAKPDAIVCSGVSPPTATSTPMSASLSVGATERMPPSATRNAGTETGAPSLAEKTSRTARWKPFVSATVRSRRTPSAPSAVIRTTPGAVSSSAKSAPAPSPGMPESASVGVASNESSTGPSAGSSVRSKPGRTTERIAPPLLVNVTRAAPLETARSSSGLPESGSAAAVPAVCGAGACADAAAGAAGAAAVAEAAGARRGCAASHSARLRLLE